MLQSFWVEESWVESVGLTQDVEVARQKLKRGAIVFKLLLVVILLVATMPSGYIFADTKSQTEKKSNASEESMRTEEAAETNNAADEPEEIVSVADGSSDEQEGVHSGLFGNQGKEYMHLSNIAASEDAADTDDSSEILARTHTVKYYLVDRAGRNIAALPGFAAPATEFNVDDGTASTIVTAPNAMGQNYVYLGWDTARTGNPANTGAISTIIFANTNIYLVYGQDKGGGVTSGPDGIEDFTISISHKTALGGKILPDNQVHVNVGDSYRASRIVNAGYTLIDTRLDGISIGATNSYVFAKVLAHQTIEFIYSPNKYPVTVTYQHKNGTVLTGTNQNTEALHGSTFKAKVPTKKDLCLVNWKLNGVMQNNTNPSLTVNQFANIVLIYAQDKSRDGKEDVTITEIRHSEDTEQVNFSSEASLTNPDTNLMNKIDSFLLEGANNTQAFSQRDVYVNVGATYQAKPQVFTGYTYKYFRVNGGNATTGLARIANVTAPATVYLLYSLNNYTVSVRCVDSSGNLIDGHDYSQTVSHNNSYNAVAGVIEGYNYQGWRTGKEGLQTGNPSIAAVTGNTIINLVYNAQESPSQAEPTPGVGPQPTPGSTSHSTDPRNYQFIKKPNVLNVKAGEIVTYTFSGFGNNWDFELNYFSITDRPDKGIDFMHAQLPAFANGQGVTYDVIYYTSAGEEVMLHSGVSAGSPFSIEAPKLSAGVYITSIAFEFGTVPSGFAVGNTFDITFKIWDDPPAKVLTNVGMLGYKTGDEYIEFATGRTGAITIDGYFKDLAQTNDTNKATITTITALLVTSLTMMVAVIRQRKKTHQKPPIKM